MLASPRFSDLLAWAETNYDQVLIDAPPVLAASDAAIIGRMVDGVVLVVRPDKNQRRLVVRAVESFSGLGAAMLGVVINRISSGKDDKPTPTGIFSVLDKKQMHRSRKYDNAPMPWMQRIDNYGIALHAGHNPGGPASHGCVRLPAQFAKKLYSVTEVGTPVYIGA